ncbi:MAG: DNA polymerase III subunit beta [Alphaproteobacteria bacterium]|nr:DNA polymerase III subunit beta [Alphaproteobacteria bacterium]
MKFTVDRSAFLKALSHGQSVVERRTTVPILSNILISATPQGLSLITTDTDIALIETVPAIVLEPGTTTVSAQMLFEIIRKMPEASTIELTLMSETGQLNIKEGRSRFNLSCLPSEDFPQLTQGELPYRFSLPVAIFKKLLDRAKFAMSTEETRYYLNGIYLHTLEREGQKILRSVATDAHRLAYIEVPLPPGAEGMPGIIIGRKTVTEVRKLVDDTTTQVSIALSPTRIEFSFENAVLSSRLIDATYPEYEKAIPIGNDKLAIVDAKSFAAAVDRVATVSNDKVRAIKVNLNNNMLTLSAVSHDLGNAVEEMPIDFPHNTPIEIGFNARYLLDIAQQIDEDEAQVVLANGDAPAIIKGMKDQEATYILMPMRV